MQIRIGTLVKLPDNSTIYRVTTRSTRTGLLDQYKLVNNTSGELHPTLVTIFGIVIVENRTLYKEVLAYKIDFKKKIVTKLNKEIKEFRLIKSNLDKFSSDEEELNEFIAIFKSEKSKSLVKLVATKEHINFKKFLTEWVE